MQFYIPHLEWEAIDFPLIIKGIRFEKLALGLSEDSWIELWRADDYSLHGVLHGITQNPAEWDQDFFAGAGNIVTGDTVTGKDSSGNTVTIEKCLINDISTHSHRLQNGYEIASELSFDSCKINYLTNEETGGEKLKLLWYLCDKVPADLSEITFRKKNQSNPKARTTMDTYDDSVNNISGSSSSRDYITFSLAQHTCIIAKVPKEFGPRWGHGLCIELRGDSIPGTTDTDLNNLEDFLSFLFGNTLVSLGYSLVNNHKLVESYATELMPSWIKEKTQSAMPPVKFNRQYEWGDISWLEKQLFPNYLSLAKPLQLGNVLSRYFIAREMPLGTNLTVLANALEILAGNYLKMKGQFDLPYMEDKAFRNLIASELASIKEKLGDLEGGETMLNKIKVVNNRYPSEKIKLFLALAGIKIGKAEKDALALRNKMAHSARDYTDQKNVNNDIVLTRVYQGLFNRTVLNLLGYTGYYIDYSIKGSPLKHVSKPAGETMPSANTA